MALKYDKFNFFGTVVAKKRLLFCFRQINYPLGLEF